MLHYQISDTIEIMIEEQLSQATFRVWDEVDDFITWAVQFQVEEVIGSVLEQTRDDAGRP